MGKQHEDDGVHRDKVDENAEAKLEKSKGFGTEVWVLLVLVVLIVLWALGRWIS